MKNSQPKTGKMEATERSLYSHISNYLNSLDGISAAEELKTPDGYPDIVFHYKPRNMSFILQVKVGERKMTEGICDVERHATGLNINNKIIFEYPDTVRQQVLPLGLEFIKDIALETPINAVLLIPDVATTHFEKKKVKDIIHYLYDLLKKKEKPVYNPETIIKGLRECVEIFSATLQNATAGKRIYEVVTGQFELFTALGETEKISKADLQLAILDLASYIFVNQIVFYRIYSSLTTKVKPLTAITSFKDLRSKFNAILDINYRPIYRVDVLSCVEDNSNFLVTIDEIITSVQALKPEEMRHDVMGRLFHELLPQITRKKLAAFYTRPVAAEILAGLAIKNYDAKVLDPACGSGTLLVSAYKRKKELLQENSKDVDLESAHRKFIEEEITGVDIMPFASHLTAVNLVSQSPNVTIKKTLTYCGDSLIELYQLGKLKTHELALGDAFLEAGRKGVLHKGVDEKLDDKLEKINKESDVVIMNPPFTKRKRMNPDYRNKLTKIYEEKVGNTGLWGPFMLLGVNYIKECGIFAGVIPINLLRGRETQKVREYFFKDGSYRCKYIIKSISNLAFSEGAAYKDILITFEKTIAKDDNSMTGIILLKADLDKLSIERARDIAKEISAVKESSDEEHNDFDIYWVKNKELSKNSSNLMPFVSVSSIKNKNIINHFLTKCAKANNIVKMKAEWFREGFRPVPEGLSKILFITNPTEPSRVERAEMILEKGNKTKLYVINPKIGKFNIEKSKCLPSLRTITGLKTMDITDKLDWVIKEDYTECKKIKTEIGYKHPLDWEQIKKDLLAVETNLVIARRINLFSPNTFFLSWFSNTRFYPSNLSEVVKTGNTEYSKILCLVINSAWFFTQFFIHKEESTGEYLDIRISEIEHIDTVDYTNLSISEKKALLDCFEKIKDKEFPSLMEQFKNPPPARITMDKTVLKILGFDNEEIDEWLPKIYKVLYEEMEIVKRMR